MADLCMFKQYLCSQSVFDATMCRTDACEAVRLTGALNLMIIMIV
jgi:hypothetical protein